MLPQRTRVNLHKRGIRTVPTSAGKNKSRMNRCSRKRSARKLQFAPPAKRRKKKEEKQKRLGEEDDDSHAVYRELFATVDKISKLCSFCLEQDYRNEELDFHSQCCNKYVCIRCKNSLEDQDCPLCIESPPFKTFQKESLKESKEFLRKFLLRPPPPKSKLSAPMIRTEAESNLEQNRARRRMPPHRPVNRGAHARPRPTQPPRRRPIGMRARAKAPIREERGNPKAKPKPAKTKRRRSLERSMNRSLSPIQGTRAEWAKSVSRSRSRDREPRNESYPKPKEYMKHRRAYVMQQKHQFKHWFDRMAKEIGYKRKSLNVERLKNKNGFRIFPIRADIDPKRIQTKITVAFGSTRRVTYQFADEIGYYEIEVKDQVTANEIDKICKEICRRA